MTAPEDVLKELKPLLESLREDDLTEEQFSRLEHLLTLDHASRLEYLRSTTLHTHLHWHFSRGEAASADDILETILCETELPARSDSLAHVDSATNENERSFGTARPSILGIFGRALPKAIHPERHPAAFLVAASLLTALFCGSLVLMIWWPGHRDRGTQQVQSHFIATITHTDQAAWSPGQSGVQLGARLFSGHRLELKSGRVHLLFHDGARVVVEGPAKFRVDEGGAMTLEEGRLLARVSKQAQGFTVATPLVDLVDLGTVFGVHVRKVETEVQVFKGKVEVRRRDHARASDDTLVAGEATVFGSSPQQGFYAKEKKMNRAVYLTLAALLATPPTGASAVAILPSSIPGNVLWLHAGASQTGSVGSGNPVSAWSDASTLGTNDASQSGTARPTWTADGGATFNNQPVLSFDGSNDFMLIADNDSLDSTNAMTWFFVARQDVAAINQTLLSKWEHGTSVSYLVQTGGTDSYLTATAISTGDVGNTLGTTSSPAIGLTSANLLSVQFDGSGATNADRLKMFTNTAATTISYLGTIPSSLTNSTASAAVGALTGSLTRYWNGDIAEIIMFDRLLTDGSLDPTDNELNDVNFYLDQKYNLGLGLQATPAPPAPEPASGALLGLGGMMLVRFARRRKRQQRKVA